MKRKIYCIDCGGIMSIHTRWDNSMYANGKKIKIIESIVFECPSCGMRVREEVELD